MTLKPALIYHLLNDSGVSAIVEDRVYWKTAPQTETFPYIVCMKVSGVPYQCISGEAGMERAVVQLDCYAAGEEDASELAEAVRLAIDGFYGVMGEDPDDVRVSRMQVDGMRDSPDAAYRGEEIGISCTSIDALIIYDIEVATFS